MSFDLPFIDAISKAVMLAERARFDALERTPTIKSNHANIAYRSEFLVLTNTSPKREVRLICGCRHSLFGSAILSSIIDIFAGYMKPKQQRRQLTTRSMQIAPHHHHRRL